MSKLATAVSVLLDFGPRAFLRRTLSGIRRERLRRVRWDTAYARWLRAQRPDETALRTLTGRLAGTGDLPRVDVAFFRRPPDPTTAGLSRGSVAVQAYGAVRLLEEPGGPPAPGEESGGAGRAARLRGIVEETEADVLLLIEPGDRLWPNAVAELVMYFREVPEAIAAYGDEEVPGGGNGWLLPRLKPGWSPTLYGRGGYPGRPLAVRVPPLREALRGVAGSAADPLRDLLLRVPAASAAIGRIPRILLTRGPADAGGPEQAPPARETGSPADGTEDPAAEPSLSVVIPTRDGLRFLRPCLTSLRDQEYPGPVEILVVDNGSRDPDTRSYLADLEGSGVARVVPHPGSFNFSAMMNRGARLAGGDLVLFLNDDTRALGRGCLRALAGEMRRGCVGAVGPLLLYPDGRIQHCGLVTGMGTVAGHLYRGMRPEEPRHFVSPLHPREVAAVDGACFLVRRSEFLEMGGFDEECLPVSFSDVDYCLRAREKGRRILYTPRARFLHHETQTRSPRLDAREIRCMTERWGAVLERDPFYHPGLSLLDESARLDLPGGGG